MEERRIEIYQGLEGEVIFDVDAEEETIWATQVQIAKVFGVDRTVIGRHLGNIFNSEELEEKRVCAKNAHTGPDGKTYQVKMYNLDAIISVGYRVNSKKATKFRVWATGVLKKYVTDGVAINERRLQELKTKKELEKLENVEKIVNIVRRLTAGNILDSKEANGIIEIISRYAGSFQALKEFSEGHIDLSFMSSRRRGKKLTLEMCTSAITRLAESEGENKLFGKERGKQFREGLQNIFRGDEGSWADIPEKAAKLLYFIVKNKPFYDGNKRIGALLFILFLTINQYHLTEKGETKISDRALTAITLLISESEEGEKDLVINLVRKLLQ